MVFIFNGHKYSLQGSRHVKMQLNITFIYL